MYGYVSYVSDLKDVIGTLGVFLFFFMVRLLKSQDFINIYKSKHIMFIKHNF